MASTTFDNISMNQDDTFRIILILGLLVVLPIGIYHRLKSQATGEKLDYRWQTHRPACRAGAQVS